MCRRKCRYGSGLGRFVSRTLGHPPHRTAAAQGRFRCKAGLGQKVPWPVVLASYHGAERWCVTVQFARQALQNAGGMGPAGVVDNAC